MFMRAIFMIVSYRFIPFLEAIKSKKKCSWNLDKAFTRYLQGTSISSKVKIRGVPSRLQEYIPVQTIHFTGALKTYFLLKFFFPASKWVLVELYAACKRLSRHRLLIACQIVHDYLIKKMILSNLIL